ncbi:hypothetical protein ElP_42880 [Tautonia plasticadhaerens]|uniref:Uncharacterized protein n=1 Tax=Tautonia plasticadhaerens TaxID=2527974 RepID=A0A518H6A2_9BACT|nr:hypothetical protein ElP_42880 [Tautonia plasticadhaerens]
MPAARHRLKAVRRPGAVRMSAMTWASRQAQRRCSGAARAATRAAQSAVSVMADSLVPP